jgi:hypothetical protein
MFGNIVAAFFEKYYTTKFWKYLFHKLQDSGVFFFNFLKKKIAKFSQKISQMYT